MIIENSIPPQVSPDKAEGRIEISATVSEDIAKALDNSEAVFGEGSAVTLTNIAGAGFEPATFGL